MLSLSQINDVASSGVPLRLVAKRALLGAAFVSGAIAAAYYGHDYWTIGQYLVSTDDAYVKADFTTVAPKVSGYIAEVAVKDNQTVVAGQVLARIDSRDFETALDQARADVAAAQAALRNLDAQITLQGAVIDQGNANLVATDAGLKFARQDDARYRDLAQTGAGTLQHAQQAAANTQEFAAKLDRDRAAVVASKKQVDVLASARARAEAELAHAQAVAHQAELNLSYTTITAAMDGSVGSRSLRVGQYVQAGTQLMAVVPLNAAYVVANFKETQLTHIRAGQPVSIKVDGFPGKALKGHVDSLSPASGLEFSLLPPDNATGNFTKIVQRIPVKIVLDDRDLAGLLRSGMSVEPTVDTKSAAQAE